MAPTWSGMAFDPPDRPTEFDVHDRLVEILEWEGIRATFFVQGRWAEAYPARARELATRGHLIGSHSFYHVRMPLLSPAGLETLINTIKGFWLTWNEEPVDLVVARVTSAAG